MKIVSGVLSFSLLVGLFVLAAPASAATPPSIAIIYGSRYGSTAQTAAWIAEGMAGRAVVVAAKDAGDLSGYESVILGSGIYGDRLHADMAAFLEKRSGEIKGKLLALFVVCGMPPDQAGGYLKMFAEKCQAKPLLTRAFNGWMKKEILNPEDFKGLESYYKSAGYPFENYDRTDKTKCLEFGKEILEKSGATAPAGSLQGDEEAIKAVILSAYRDGLCNVGDVELVKKGFHPEFRLLGIRDDALTILPIADWIKMTEAKKADGRFPPRVLVNMELPLIDITGSAAMVKVKFLVGDRHVYTDYLSLYRFAEGWKIVAKIFAHH